MGAAASGNGAQQGVTTELQQELAVLEETDPNTYGTLLRYTKPITQVLEDYPFIDHWNTGKFNDKLKRNQDDYRAALDEELADTEYHEKLLDQFDVAGNSVGIGQCLAALYEDLNIIEKRGDNSTNHTKLYKITGDARNILHDLQYVLYGDNYEQYQDWLDTRDVAPA